MEMIPLNNHEELESGRKLEMGNSYLYFHKEGKPLPTKRIVDSDYSQHHDMKCHC